MRRIDRECCEHKSANAREYSAAAGSRSAA
jgi:hypothetical protein